MKFKKIMLVTFVLLAILTLGAVSAADDVASDGLAVGDVKEVALDDVQATSGDIIEDSDDIVASSNDEGSNIISNGDYNIIFNEDDEYNQADDFETPVVNITVPEGSNGRVIATAEGVEGNLVDCEIDDLDYDDDSGVYYLVPDSFGQLEDGTYVITVSYMEGENIRASQSGTLTFNSEEGPFIMIERVLYIGADYGNLVVVRIPSEIDNATIIVKIDGNETLTISLDEFEFVEESDGAPYWFHPSFGPGDPIESLKEYNIWINHLNYEFDEGTYEVTAILNIEGMDPIVETDKVSLFNRNVASNENITIEIFKGDYQVGDEYTYLIVIDADESCEGTFLITVADNDWSRELTFDDLEDDGEGCYYITPVLFEELGDGEYEITVAYIENDEEILNTTANINFYYDDEDADDGVLIMVPNGDEAEYNIDEDMDAVFASVSVSNELNGNITISIYMDEDEPVEIVFFNKNLSEITNKEEDPDLEDFTIYNIALSDLGGFDAFLEYAYFEIAFISDDEECVDCRDYDIEIDEDNDNIIRFWECGDDDEMHGEGEEIDAEFTNANILNNDPVVTISKDDIPEDVDNEFTVIIPQEDDDPMEIPLKLDEILEGDNYVIRVNDLNIPEFKESFGILMIVQFYTEGEESYYAEWMDEDEAIHIYESPCIFDEISLLNEDDVITIQEIPGGVDEFTVTISKEGSDDIVKTFKFSEFDIDEEEVWVAFKLEDLGITEIGEYTVTVKYSEDLTYSGNLNVTRNVDIRGPDEDDEGEPVTYTSVDERVVNFRISENVKGYVKVYVNGVQVGENLNLTDLPMGSHPPHDGRLIVLNVLNIAESDEYNVKVELYSDADELLGDDEFNIKVEVGENSAQINEGSYAYGTEANDEIIEYTIGAPLLEGQYFNIYFNGVKAGNITANGMEFNDLFTVQMFDVKLFKPGTYNVNVTFFDGETETDLANGTISINELTLTSNKEVYILDEDYVIISFNMSSVADNARLDAYYVYDWGPVGRADSMVFNPYFGDQLKDELYDDGVISFDVAWITDEDGIDHFRLDEGTTLIYVTYNNGNGQELGGFITVNVTKVTPVDPNFNITIENVEEGTPIVVSVSANENFTGDVVVKVDGKDVLVRVTNGIGKNSTTGVVLSAKDNYEATIDFAANDVFNAGNAQTTFNVIAKASSGSNASANATSAQNTTQETPATPTTPETPAQKDTIKLVLKTVKVKKSAKKLILQATLKVNGKAVNKKLIVFKFNGKTYKAKTNKKGIAKVTVKKAVLKKLKVGKKVKYQAKYSTKTVKKTAKVKK